MIVLLLAVLSGCGGGGGGGGPTGGGGGSADTTPPAISITYPTEGTEYTISTLPDYISLNYSDSQSAIIPSTLNITFSFNSRAADISGLFGKDPVLNAASSQSDQSNPLSIAVVSRYSNSESGFSGVLGTAAVRREGAGALRITCESLSSKAIIWNPADTKVYMADIEGDLTVSPADLGFAPTVVSTGGNTGKFHVGRGGYAALNIYSETSGQLVSTISLPDEPLILAHHTQSGKLYISYKTDPRISRFDTSSDALDSFAAMLDAPPVLLETRRGQSAAGVFAVAVSGSRFHLFEYDQDGALLRDVELKQTQPKDMKFTASGHVYLSNYSDNTVTRVTLSDNSKQEIAVGQFPKRMFGSDADSVYVINSGDRTITKIQGASAGTASVMQPLPLDGNADCSQNFKYVVEDILSVTSRLQGTISASIKDAIGNRGSASINIFIKPESIGVRILNPAANRLSGNK